MKKTKHERVAEGLISLVRVFRLMGCKGSQGMKPPPLHPQYWVLWMLMRKPRTMTELSYQLQRSKPNMTAIVGKLMREGKVRHMQGQKDHRVVMIEITPKGRAFTKQLKRNVREAIRKNISGLSDYELDYLCNSLENVNAIMEKILREKYGGA